NEQNAQCVEDFFQTHLPQLTLLFNQPLVRSRAPPPQPIIEIIQRTISFASSMKRHRRLPRLIQVMLDNRASTRDFQTLHEAKFTPGAETCSLDGVIREISQLTKTPDYYFTRGQKSASDIVPEARYCSPREWNDMVRGVREWRQRLQNDMTFAQREMGRMAGD